MNQEIPFQTGESNSGVVRVGDTVRRNLGPNSERVYSIMNSLTSAGFELSPQFIGIDEKGREIITYIPGELVSTSEIALETAKQSMKALRRFHDILAKTDLKEDEETVCHRDFAPWNVLQLDNQIVGIIDFDDAYPGKRVTDIAYACWTFLNLGNSSNKKTNEQQIDKIKMLIEAYGEVDTSGFIEELNKEQNRILEYRKARIESADNYDEREDREQIYNEILKQIKWVEDNSAEIEKAIS